MKQEAALQRDSLAAAAALHPISVLTVNVCGHQVKCVCVCLCVRDDVLVHLVGKQMFTAIYAAYNVTNLTSYSCTIIGHRNRCIVYS